MSGAFKPAEEILEMLDEAAKNSQEKDERIKELKNQLRNRTITYPCLHCGEEIIFANKPEVEVIREYLKSNRWAHTKCNERAKSCQ